MLCVRKYVLFHATTRKCISFSYLNRPHLSHTLHTLGSLGFRDKHRPMRKLRSSRTAELCRVGMVLRGKRTYFSSGIEKTKYSSSDGTQSNKILYLDYQVLFSQERQCFNSITISEPFLWCFSFCIFFSWCPPPIKSKVYRI